MRYGIIAEPSQIASVAAAGFDYAEMDINRLLSLDADGYRAMAVQMEKHGIYAEVLFGLLPDHTQVVGANVSASAIHEALRHSFELAKSLGTELMVFDCAASRKMPKGAEPSQCWRQLGNALRTLQGYAAEYGVETALLPLQRRSGALVNHLQEAVLIPSILGLDHIGIAASRYHMAMESEPQEALRGAGGLLRHVRASNVLGNRMPKRGDGEDYEKLLHVLSGMNYAGRITCEGSTAAFEHDAAEAVACLRAAERSAV